MASYSKEYRGTAIVLCAAFVFNLLAYDRLQALESNTTTLMIAILVNIVTCGFFFSLRSINIGNKAAEHQMILLCFAIFISVLMIFYLIPIILYMGLITLINLATIYILRGGINELIRYGISNVRLLNDILSGYNILCGWLGGYDPTVQTDRADKKTMAKSKGKAQ